MAWLRHGKYRQATGITMMCSRFPGVLVFPHFVAKFGVSWHVIFGHHTDTKKPPRI